MVWLHYYHKTWVHGCFNSSSQQQRWSTNDDSVVMIQQTGFHSENKRLFPVHRRSIIHLYTSTVFVKQHTRSGANFSSSEIQILTWICRVVALLHLLQWECLDWLLALTLTLLSFDSGEISSAEHSNILSPWSDLHSNTLYVYCVLSVIQLSKLKTP